MKGLPDLEFAHRLVLKIGGMTVEELGSRMNADEFANWKAWCELQAEKGDLNDLSTMVERSLT